MNNLERVILFAALVLLCGCGTGTKATIQKQIVRQDAVFEDYIPLLKKAGYNVFSFDISSLQDTLKAITVDVREYEYGKRTNYRGGYVHFSNMKMISDFSEFDQEKILAEGLADAPERGIYRLAEKLTLAFSPGKNPSQVTMTASMRGMGTFVWPLHLRPLDLPSYESDSQYLYEYRPFELDSFVENEFIPLVLYGSFWKDGEIAHFCGEEVLSSDMSSDMISRIPHFYVVGITVSDLDMNGNTTILHF